MRHLIVIAVALFVLTGCGSKKSTGYTDPKEVYIASMKALQSKDRKTIGKFVNDVLPDNGTVRFLEKNNFDYRGIPNELKEEPNALKEWREDFTNRLVKFSLELEARGILKDLKFIGFDEDYEPEEIEKGSGILFTEPYGVFGTPTDTIEYKIGELLKINGVWKSFTEAKL